MPQVEQLWLEEDLEEDVEMGVLVALLLVAATLHQWLVAQRTIHLWWAKCLMVTHQSLEGVATTIHLIWW